MGPGRGIRESQVATCSGRYVGYAIKIHYSQMGRREHRIFFMSMSDENLHVERWPMGKRIRVQGREEVLPEILMNAKKTGKDAQRDAMLPELRMRQEKPRRRIESKKLERKWSIILLKGSGEIKK
jgi:hypothetical protein